MPHGYEDIHDLDELDDSELRELVVTQLREHGDIDVGEITVNAADGCVTLSGRVGTDGERRIAEHVLTDVLGIKQYANDLIVDTSVRAENPEGADEMVDETREARDEYSERPLSDIELPLRDRSQALADRDRESPDGSADLNEVMEEGLTWNPPDRPTPEGLSGSDAGPEEMNGRH